MTDIALHLALQGLQDRYVTVLDNDALEEWPNLFVEDCLYEIIAKENVDAGLPAPVIHCNNKRMLRDRIVSLRHANIFQPTTYRHFLSGMQWQRGSDGAVSMQTNYLVVATDLAGNSEVYQTGRYLDEVVETRAGWRFRSRRAVYDTSRIQTLLAIPI